MKTFRINGWSGERDETGAQIVDEKGTFVCHTASEDYFHGPEKYEAYRGSAEFIVTALNHYSQHLASLDSSIVKIVTETPSTTRVFRRIFIYLGLK
jgi:hypothetical protein